MTIKYHVEFDFLVSVFDNGDFFHYDRITDWDRLDLDANNNMYQEGTIYAEDGKEYGIEIRIWFKENKWLDVEYEGVQDGIMNHILTFVSHSIVPTDFHVKGYLQ